jgi:hypothetical protein
MFNLIVISCLQVLIMFFFFLENQNVYICPNKMCQRTYKFKTSLNKHVRLECGGQKKFNCSICPKAFSQKVTLLNHLAIIHNYIE